MLSRHLVSIFILALITGLVTYRSSFFKNKKIFHLSLLQILYLIVLPGTIFILINSYMQSLLAAPRVLHPFIRDGILVDTIYLSMFFTYGGVAIHAVTKMLSETSLRYDNSEASQINRYFHLNFSHNLVYGGAILFVATIALLELNHTQSYDFPHLSSLIIRGLVLGLIVFISMFNYTRSKDQYAGRWADFKAVFLIAWAGLILLFIAVKKSDAEFLQYQLLLPIILTLGTVASINIILAVRRIHRHKLYSPHRFIAFYRKKRHPTVQKTKDNLKRGLQHEIENEHQEVEP